MCRSVEALLTKMIFITATAPVITTSSLAFKLLRNSNWPGGQLFLVKSHFISGVRSIMDSVTPDITK